MDKNDEIILEANGWIVECESPFEIRNEETESFASNQAAYEILRSLKRDMEDQRKLAQKEREKWEEKHRACPKCGEVRIGRTYLAPIHIAGEPYKDDVNRATCTSCKWSGTPEDLVPDYREYGLKEVKYRYAVDICRYYAFNIPKKIAYLTLLENNINRHLVQTGIIQEFRIVFDETIWYPIDEGAYKNIIQFSLKLNHSPVYLIFQFDLREPIDQAPKFIY